MQFVVLRTHRQYIDTLWAGLGCGGNLFRIAFFACPRCATTLAGGGFCVIRFVLQARNLFLDKTSIKQ